MEKLTKKHFNNGYIDCHTHCGVDYRNLYLSRYPLSQCVTQLNECLLDAGISYAITFPMPNTLYFDIRKQFDLRLYAKSNLCDFPFQIENNYMINEIEHFSYSHILPFLSFSLQCEVDKQIRFIDSCMRETAIYGLKFHPYNDCMSIMELEKHEDFLNFIEEHNLPIICHTGIDNVSDPSHVLKFAYNHPKIRICAAHFANCNQNFFSAIEMEFPENLFLDIAPLITLCERCKSLENHVSYWDYANPINFIKQIYQMYPQNIIWGTDHPWTYNHKLKNSKSKQMVTYKMEVDILKQTGFISNIIAQKNILKFLFG